MKLKDAIVNKLFVESMGATIENNVIKSVNVDIVGHFGNAVCLEILCEDVRPVSMHQNIGNLGYVIRALVEFFDLSEDDGIKFSQIKNVPCRLVLDKSGRCVGFGDFMKDKFVLTSNFVNIDE